jgi:hypothetical protein
MRPGAIVFGLLGLLLAATSVLLFAWDEQALAYGLLAGAAAASFVTAIVLQVVPRAAPEWDTDLVRPLPNESWAATSIGVGVSLIGTGVVFGFYLVLIGGGLVLAGIAGMFRERRAARRALPPYAHGPLDPGGSA